MHILWNRTQGRLRSLWRLLFQYLLYVFGASVLGTFVFAAFVPSGGTSLEDLTFGGWAAAELWYVAQ